MSRIKLWRDLINALQEHELTVAFAESMTCGLAAHNLSKVTGTMKVLRGGIICYRPEVKTQLMKIPKAVIKKHTAESQIVTTMLARALQKIIKADIHAAITGLAAPGGSESKQKPVGTTFFAIALNGKIIEARKIFHGSPQQIRQQACDELYALMLKEVKKNSPRRSFPKKS